MIERMTVEIITGTKVIFEGTEQIDEFYDVLLHFVRTGEIDCLNIKNIEGNEVDIFINYVVLATIEEKESEQG